VALDSGYEVSIHGKQRFDQYLEMAAAYDMLGFEIDEKSDAGLKATYSHTAAYHCTMRCWRTARFNPAF